MNINGTIPPFICDLNNLTVLDCFNNSFTGMFPVALFNCSKLQFLDLSQNLFVGFIPDDIDRFSRLSSLNVSGNNFTGNIPAAIGLLQKLKELDFDQNKFNGTFPPEIGNLSNLERLSMAYNGFLPSRLPSSFTQLKKLKWFWISHSNLIGEIPEAIGEMVALDHLDLAGNRLTGNIPTRTIPDDFGKLRKLSLLKLFYNQLSGEIPQSIGRLPALAHWEAACIFMQWRNLVGVAAFDNNLNGELPESLGNCSSLLIVSVSRNAFSGNIPVGLWTAFNLTYLLLSDNLFMGELPNEVSGNLSRLEISNNKFSGEIPISLENAAYNNSFLNNPGLCTRSSLLSLNVCNFSTQKSSENSTKPIALISSVLATVFALASLLSFLVIRVYQKKKQALDSEWKLTSFQKLDFTVSDILSGLTETNLIGSGGSGKVYRVATHRSSLVVAVKRICNDKKLLVKKGEATVSVVAGSFGYIAPEYAQTARMNEKIDVYSFGVVLLELTTGKEASFGDENTCLADWARRHMNEGRPIVDALDKEIMESSCLDEMSFVFQLGVKCTNKLPSARPSMREVLQILLHYSHPLVME
ncbi:hypothetical protein GH714_039033 [Hevea brasiliensis]|uniref:Protein kinase domain-containing protein n=1 Tax=Hevea brasiliensis TaxID=3981 RepID=A0A6A6KAT0_HEVBR|nr:hypothetical protein GH714_039033 [Hevea brasiliensis]